MPRLATLSFLFLCFGTAFAQTHQHGSTPGGDGRFNPFVVPDNRGGFYLAYVERADGASDVMLRHSKDGRAFSDPVRVNSREGDATVRNENPPKVAVAPNGDVYVCWANETARWKGNIRFARSSDGGRTFLPSVTINSDEGRGMVGHAFQSITVDKRGRVYIAWIDERNKKEQDRGAEIWISTSEDGGRTFSRDRKILSDVCECCRTNIQMDSAGRLFLAYRTVPPAGPMYRDIVVARSEDGGKTFSPVTVSKDGWEIEGCPVMGPALSVDEKDRITAVWFTGGDRQGLYYATSSDRGASYSARRLVDPDRSLGRHAQGVTMRGGRIVVAWDEKAEKMRIVFGVLDLQNGSIRKGVIDDEVSYPSIAFNDRLIVIAGMQASTKDILLRAEPFESIEPGPHRR